MRYESPYPRYVYGIPQLIFGFFLGFILAPYSLGFILFLGYVMASAAYYLIFNNSNIVIEGGAFCAAIYGYVFGRIFVLTDEKDDPFEDLREPE